MLQHLSVSSKQPVLVKVADFVKSKWPLLTVGVVVLLALGVSLYFGLIAAFPAAATESKTGKGQEEQPVQHVEEDKGTGVEAIVGICVSIALVLVGVFVGCYCCRDKIRPYFSSSSTSATSATAKAGKQKRSMISLWLTRRQSASPTTLTSAPFMLPSPSSSITSI
jgi:hypothetical protein